MALSFEHLPDDAASLKALILAADADNIQLTASIAQLTTDRSTFAHWVGFAAVELEPLHAHLLRLLKSSTKLFADETRCPVLDMSERLS